MMTETSDKNCASDGSSSCSSSQKTSSLQAPCGEILDKESYNPAYHNGRADIKAEGINDECKAESDETEDYDGSMYDSYSSVSLTRDSHSNEMLIILRDTVITNDRNDETRAVRSLPVGLTIKASNLTDEKRVFTQALLPSAVTFGPFGGKIKQDMDSPNRYVWEIHHDNRLHHYIDGQDGSNSNWMRFVNCSSNEDKQNLEAFQYEDQIYFRTTQYITPDTELLLQSRYVKRLVTQALVINCSYLFDGVNYTLVGYIQQSNLCANCDTPFLWVEDLKIHKLKCICDSDQQVNSTENKIHNKSHNYMLRDHGDVLDESHDTEADDDVGTDDLDNNGEDNEEDIEESPVSINKQLLYNNTERQFDCHLCDKFFRHSSTLKDHIKMHLGETPHQCSSCNKTFTSISKLHRHTKVHLGNKPHNCTYCDRKFAQVSHLKAHIRIHTGRNSHECAICSKSYTMMSSLTRHMLVHKDSCPFVCSFCGDIHYTAREYEKHMRQHTGVKPYSCEICGKGFCHPANLEKHTKLHKGETPHECHICGKGFTQIVNMQAHVRVHLGEKPFDCTMCDKSFTTSSALTMHIRLHTGEVHKCDVCSEEFVHLGNLKKHMAKTHNDEIINHVPS